MKSQSPQREKAGFEYYLEQVQKGRDAARREIPVDLLQILTKSQTPPTLIELAQLYLPADASLDQINDFLATINQLEEADLVKVTGEKNLPPERYIVEASVTLTESGRKLLDSGLAAK